MYLFVVFHLLALCTKLDLLEHFDVLKLIIFVSVLVVGEGGEYIAEAEQWFSKIFGFFQPSCVPCHIPGASIH